MDQKIDLSKVRAFGGLELLAKQVVEGFITGLHKSPFHGFSVEFAEHRIYNTGESTRHIDWKLYGRSDKLFVKRFEEETNLRCHFILDTSSSMYFPLPAKGEENALNKLSFSVYCIAAIMQLMKTQRDAVGLSVFSDKVSLHTPDRSTSMHQKMIYHELEKILNSQSEKNLKKTSAANSIHQIAESIHKRSMVIIFSDMMENKDQINELTHALQHLRYNKHEVILFHVMEKELEREFKFDNHPYRFVDLETGEEIKLRPHEMKDHYLKAMDKFAKEITLRCGQYNVDMVQAEINSGFQQVLMPYLIKRAKIKG